MLIHYCRPDPVLRYKADTVSDEFLSEIFPELPLELVVLIRYYTVPRRLSHHDDRYRHLYNNYRKGALTDIRQESWWKIRIDLRHLSCDGRILRHCMAIMRWTDYVETPPKKCLTYFFVNQNTGEWSCRGETIM
jgi:hypothetical protein